ncbi:MAG TPA: ABC transporter substrate-binding protein, partial [Chloroflexota bacterium]|nr:ABC transporter substrate-binding protein [Chloroflexota bacterium]
MSERGKLSAVVTRRRLVQIAGATGIASLLLAACSQSASSPPTPAPQLTSASAPTSQPTSAAQPAAMAASTPQTASTAQPVATTAPAAVAAGATVSGTPKRGGTLNVVVQNDFVTMWPVVTTGPTAMPCYDWLVGWRRGSNGQFGPEPELAESWELSGNSATFKLRQGVTFHDGSPLNADVVKWNIEQMVNYPKSIAKVALEAIDPSKPADVIDDYTVRVNLKYPDGGLLAALSDAEATTGIVSKAAFDKLGADGLSRQAVGTGPFSFVSWQPGNQLVVKRWDKYWKKGVDGQPLPYLDQIIYKFIPDDSVRSLQMLSGTSDFTELIRATDIPKVKSTSSLVYDQVSWMGNRYRFVFNALKPPFGNNL